MMSLLFLLAFTGSGSVQAREGGEPNRDSENSSSENVAPRHRGGGGGGHYGPADETYGHRWPRYPARPPIPPRIPSDCRFSWGC